MNIKRNIRRSITRDPKFKRNGYAIIIRQNGLQDRNKLTRDKGEQDRAILDTYYRVTDLQKIQSNTSNN